MSWPTARLGDVAEELTVGFVGTMADQYVANGVRFLRSQDITPYRILTHDNKFISEEFHSRISKSRLIPGDVVIVRTGKPGTCAVVPAGLGECNCSDLVIVRPGPNLNPRYLCYYINGVAAHHVDAFTVGAVQQHFNVGGARELHFPLPRIEVQNEIASILGSLDDKIELNRRMNETLEAMARAIFRSWFIDFDPVRIKARGGDPINELCLSPEIAALFPDSFQDSVLGKIPERWKASKVGEEFRLTMGQSPPGESYNTSGDGIPFFQGKTDYGWRFPSRRLFCTAPTRFAEEGDTLVSVRAPVGAINVANERCCIGRGLAAVRHHSGASSLAYYAMGSLAGEFELFEESGTVFGSITKQGFLSLPFIAPSDEVVLAFDRVAGSLDRQIEANEKETSTLLQIRDYLLPRLFNRSINLALEVFGT